MLAVNISDVQVETDVFYRAISHFFCFYFSLCCDDAVI